MKRLYIVEVNAREEKGVSVKSYPVVNEGKKGVRLAYNDLEVRHRTVRNLRVPQLLDYGTRAKCEFDCEESKAAEEIRLWKQFLIDALHEEGQRRAVNLSRMEDEL